MAGWGQYPWGEYPWGGGATVSATISVNLFKFGSSVTANVGKTATVSVNLFKFGSSVTANVTRNASIGVNLFKIRSSVNAATGRNASIGVNLFEIGGSADCVVSRNASVSVKLFEIGVNVYGYVSGAANPTVQAVIVNARNGAHSEYIAGTSAYYKTGDIDTWKGSESMPAAKKGNLEGWMSHTGNLKCKVEGAADGIYSYPVHADGRIVMGKGLTDRWKSFKFMNCIGDTGATTLSSAVTGNKFTRASGSFITDGFAIADLFTASGFGSGVDGDYTAYSVSALEIVVVEIIPATVTGGGNERLQSNPVFTSENVRLKADATRRTR